MQAVVKKVPVSHSSIFLLSARQKLSFEKAVLVHSLDNINSMNGGSRLLS